ncbi:MAG TPA: hypothetical protein VKZ18_10020 [Polyangia bacterium]|nr:hypothetical protein [Polyangia bacterium]
MRRVFYFAAGWIVVGAACGGGRGASRADAAVDVPVAVDPRAAICAEVEAGATVGFDVVQAIFTRNCIICHAQGNDLDLVDGVAWQDLVDHAAPSAEACGGTLVVPGNPDGSYLYQKLTDPSPCSGSQMPRTDLLPDPLPDCVIALVRAWIAEGAPNAAGQGSSDGGVDAPAGG